MVTFRAPQSKMVNFRIFHNILIKKRGFNVSSIGSCQIHNPLHSTTYCKLSEIWRHRLDRFLCNWSWLIWTSSYVTVHKHFWYFPCIMKCWTFDEISSSIKPIDISTDNKLSYVLHQFAIYFIVIAIVHLLWRAPHSWTIKAYAGFTF